MENLGTVTKFANNAYDIKVKRDLVTYYHQCCFSLVVSTWLEAIENGFFCTWPGLTATVVKKYLQPSMATAKGHMKQQANNLRSTKVKVKIESDNPSGKDKHVKTGDCFLQLHQSQKQENRFQTKLDVFQ